MVKALSGLRTYIVNNRHLIPNYGERYRNGEPIATGFVESTVNEVVSKRFCKKQQMQWSKEGAHLLLQTRVRTLNGELGAIFKRWYPDMNLEVEEMPVAALPPASPCSLPGGRGQHTSPCGLFKRIPIAHKMGERLRMPLQERHATPVALAMDDDGAELARPPGWQHEGDRQQIPGRHLMRDMA